MRTQLQPVLDFLLVRTPPAWFDHACKELPILLIDHANCEKKAASSALAMTYRYVGENELLHAMSRLAREEMRHFEQVLDLMQDQNVTYSQLSAGRYAAQLHALVCPREPDRLIDMLIVGAIVEARSCERFVGLAEVLPAPVANLYQQLIHSEARHFHDYLTLAERFSNRQTVQHKTTEWLTFESELITAPDPVFRFHSGAPAPG